jgi:phenylalanyl-tRNA synthetase beta subunit
VVRCVLTGCLVVCMLKNKKEKYSAFRWCVICDLFIYIQTTTTNKNTLHSLCSLQHVLANFYDHHEVVAQKRESASGREACPLKL